MSRLGLSSSHPRDQITLKAVDPLDVITRLRERRHTAKTANVSLACVVGSDDVLLIPVEAVTQVTEVFRSGDDVLNGIRQIGGTEPAAGARKKLHYADGAALRARR